MLFEHSTPMIRLHCGCVVTGMSAGEVRFKKPAADDGSRETGSFTALVATGHGIIYYDVVSTGALTGSGEWSFYPWTRFGQKEHIGKAHNEMIYTEGEG
ncbi:hypothetical protein LCGC14_2590670 [marine sediment metagenome]|uniref:Uncharacterized protein n=1 Tax=marine sediment metagenome TaxID=412755 RepID=A0A0F9D4G8_9ZZZZ